MGEERFVGEVLEIWIVHPARADTFVQQAMDVLEQQQPYHEPGRHRRSAGPGDQIRQSGIDRLPVDLTSQPHQLVAHVDDLLQSQTEPTPGPLRIPFPHSKGNHDRQESEIPRFQTQNPRNFRFVLLRQRDHVSDI